jgi:hypothetical protein
VVPVVPPAVVLEVVPVVPPAVVLEVVPVVPPAVVELVVPVVPPLVEVPAVVVVGVGSSSSPLQALTSASEEHSANPRVSESQLRFIVKRG